MPNKCPGEWARLELTEPLCRTQGLAFPSTTEFSIDGGWLNKQQFNPVQLSSKKLFSFPTASTPSTAATTSAEKSHAFAKSRCSHRLFFFFRCQHKGHGGDDDPRSQLHQDVQARHRTTLIHFQAQFFWQQISKKETRVRRSFRILFMMFSSFIPPFCYL